MMTLTTKLDAIRKRLRAVHAQIGALESLPNLRRDDHLRLAELYEELAELTLAEGLAGGDQEPVPELAKVVAIR